MAYVFVVHPVRWERVPHVAVHPLARAWLDLQANRGMAPSTIEAYGRGLDMYLAFLSTQGTPPDKATPALVAAYVRHLASRNPSGVTNATLQQRLTVSRLFHAFLVEEGVATRNPVPRGTPGGGSPLSGGRGSGLLRRYQRLPWIPNEAEWRAILAVARAEPPRNRLMLALSYDAGLRREELCGLATGDIDPGRRLLKVRAEISKGRRERVVPYSAPTGELYAQYLRHRRELSGARGPLFLSDSRRNRARPISVWTWSKIVARLARAADLPRFTTHTLRHLCLTELALANWDVHEIATFAGHRSVHTTFRYIHLSGRDLAAKMATSMAQLHAARVRLLVETADAR